VGEQAAIKKSQTREVILLCGHSNGTTGHKITRPIGCSLRKEIHVRISLHVPSLTEENEDPTFVPLLVHWRPPVFFSHSTGISSMMKTFRT
jgi:hypothetical protein